MNIVPSSDGVSDQVQYVIKKRDKLEAYTALWKPHWKEISDYVLPQKNDVYGGAIAGEKKDNYLFDSIGVQSCDRLASALHGMLVNPGTQWFALSTGDALVDTNQDVSKWLQDTAKQINSAMQNSNFQPEIHEVLVDLCGIGTALLRIEEDEIDIFRFKASPIYDVRISENYNGLIDTVYYTYKMTMDQMADAFGDKVPAELQEERLKDPLKEYCIIHAVEPTHRLPVGLQHPMLPFTSLHVLQEKSVLLKVAGFEEDPCIVPRFSKISGEMYGRSPAMRALSDIKSVNAMKKAVLEGIQLQVAPPIQVPDEGVLMPVRTSPRSINYYRAGSKDRIEALNLGGNVGIGEQMIESMHKGIEKSFYLDQLHMVENDRMTATEVMQRRDEQLRSLAPLLGRLQHELLRPMIVRVFGIMGRRNLIPPLPEMLRGKKLEVRFVSQLARAQESIEADNFLKAFNVIGSIAQMAPQSLDYLNTDEVVKFSMRTYGAPLVLLNKKEEVDTVRQQRAEQQEQARQAQMAQMESQSANQMAQASQATANTPTGA